MSEWPGRVGIDEKRKIRYRHIGHAFASPLLSQANTYQGFATDMYGNGETVEGDYRGGLVMTIIDRDTIQVSNGWNETWKRVPVTNYQPLPAPTTCGKYFDQYSVQSIDTYSAIQRRKNLPLKVTPGIRCVMRTGAPNTTWFGIGNWHGKQYAHLVTGSSKGYGSSDFCTSPEDYCGSASYGSIRRRISPTWKRPIVDGWNEIWMKKLK
jgi:hypothetical protein